jgi:4-hydroxybenzoate polyprenyltransferase
MAEEPVETTESGARPCPSHRGAVAIADLVATARPDQWAKHVFMLPGFALALALGSARNPRIVVGLALGVASACLMASANYVLNDWLDSRFDRVHPVKGRRPAAMGRLSRQVVYCEYAVLATAGLLLAGAVSVPFVLTSVLFIASGIMYNVPPLRTKDRKHLDIASEAINSPLRLLLGWFVVSSTTIPPLSVLLLYWCGGAFLMATKRLSEYRYLTEHGDGLAGRYRRSFESYDQTSLLMFCVLYVSLASFFLAIFLIKYRPELILSVPLFAWLFAYQLRAALDDQSLVRGPEEFYRQPGLMVLMVALLLVVVALSFVDIPVVERLMHSEFTALELHW